MKTLKLSLILFVLFTFISTIPAKAVSQNNNNQDQRQICFCHTLNNNPQTICVNRFNDLFVHVLHVWRGKDSFGKCGVVQTPIEPPSVPEFGLVTGAITFLTSGGAMYFLRKRA